MPEKKPTLAEVMLQKATDIGPAGMHDEWNSRDNWMRGEMPLTPGGITRGPLGRLLGWNKASALFPKGAETLTDLLMGRRAPVAPAMGDTSFDPHKNVISVLKDLSINGLLNNPSTVQLRNKIAAPIEGQGIPTTIPDIIQKPWVQYQMNRLAGTPAEHNPNPLLEKP